MRNKARLETIYNIFIKTNIYYNELKTKQHGFNIFINNSLFNMHMFNIQHKERANKSCFIYTETSFIRKFSRERTCPDKRGFTVFIFPPFAL